MTERLFTHVRHAEKGPDGLLTPQGLQMSKEEGLLYVMQRPELIIEHSPIERAGQTAQQFYAGARQGHKDTIIGSPYERAELGVQMETFTPETLQGFKEELQKKGFGAALQYWWDKHQDTISTRCDYWKQQFEQGGEDPLIERMGFTHSGPLEILEAQLTGKQAYEMEEMGFLDRLVIRAEGKDIVDVQRVPSVVYHRD